VPSAKIGSLSRGEQLLTFERVAKRFGARGDELGKVVLTAVGDDLGFHGWLSDRLTKRPIESVHGCVRACYPGTQIGGLLAVRDHIRVLVKIMGSQNVEP
jgi:hypothetical protein